MDRRGRLSKSVGRKSQVTVVPIAGTIVSVAGHGCTYTVVPIVGDGLVESHECSFT